MELIGHMVLVAAHLLVIWPLVGLVVGAIRR